MSTTHQRIDDLVKNNDILLFIMEGDMTDVLQALQHAREAEQLAELEVNG